MDPGAHPARSAVARVRLEGGAPGSLDHGTAAGRRSTRGVARYGGLGGGDSAGEPARCREVAGILRAHGSRGAPARNRLHGTTARSSDTKRGRAPGARRTRVSSPPPRAAGNRGPLAPAADIG